MMLSGPTGSEREFKLYTRSGVYIYVGITPPLQRSVQTMIKHGCQDRVFKALAPFIAPYMRKPRIETNELTNE